MIKKIIKNLTLIIFIIVAVRVAQWIGQSQGANLLSPFLKFKTPKTIVIKEPLFVPKPMGKPSIIWRFTHTRPQPRERGTGIYEPWMDNIYSAINFSMENKTLTVWYNKGKDVQWTTIPIMPTKKYTWEGTDDGYNFYQDRFGWDWLGWNKLTLGTKVYYDRDVNPYVQTGIKIKRLNISIGIDKHSIYGDINWRVW